MKELTTGDRLRKEEEILDRLEQVKRLIQMETTLLTVDPAAGWARYCMVDRDGNAIGDTMYTVLHNVREEIQVELLSITAMCYGAGSDCGEPGAMLEFKERKADLFYDTWRECMYWNA